MRARIDNEFIQMQQATMRARPTTYARTTCINFIFGDGQNTIPTPPFEIETQVGFNGIITLARIKADAVGSATFTLTYGDYTTDYGVSLTDFTNGNNPTLTAAVKAEMDISPWKRYVRVQDEMLCTLTSASGLKRVTLSLTFRLIRGGQLAASLG